MALVISNNMVLTQQQETGSAGLIGYQNLLNVNNVTASSALDTNPITNVANPATAYTWESAIADYAGSISYDGTNLMPSPFNPEGWNSNSSANIVNVSQPNPSGESFVGMVDSSIAGNLLANRTDDNTSARGEVYYISYIFKDITSDYELSSQFQDQTSVNPSEELVFNPDGTVAIPNTDLNYLVTDLNDGYKSIQVSREYKGDSIDTSQINYIRNAQTGTQLYMQASFAGKNPLEYPYALYNEFQDNAELSDWQFVRTTGSISGGILNFLDDPAEVSGYMQRLSAQGLASFSGGKYSEISIRWRPNVSSGGPDSVLRFGTVEGGNFSGNYALNFGPNIVSTETTTTGPDAEGFYITVFDLSGYTYWASETVNGIRIDWDISSDLGPADYDIDYIKTYSPSLLQAYKEWWPAVIDPAGVKINVNTAGQSIDYIGIARHNLNQVGLTVSLKFDGITILQNQSVSDIQAIMLLVNEAAPDDVQIIINGATMAPQIGVIYVGKALQLERNIYVGHTPITYGRNRKTVNGVSENGQYLGEIVVRQTNTTSVSLQNLTPDWYRDFLDPFFKLTPRVPCFWAWRPQGFPDEVGYCWIEGEPSMSNQRSNGMVEASWNFKGIA